MTVFFDPGYIEVGGARLRCWKKGGHGSQTFLQVVENSCNPGFVTLGQRLGKETLFKYIRNFGFGSKTGVDMIGEGNGILFKLPQVGPVELATTAFGQGVSVTPIQQVQLYQRQSMAVIFISLTLQKVGFSREPEKCWKK